MTRWPYERTWAYALLAWNAKLVPVLAALLVGLDLKLDAGFSAVIVGLFVCLSSMWQSWTLTKVHTLVNSNFTEAKAARVAAESALKTAEAMNVSLREQLDAANRAIPSSGER